MSGFASTKDLADKTISFEELGPGLYGYTAEGDPNSGVVIGDRSVLVVDAQATPKMAHDVLARIRQVTHKPVRHVVLSHYHAGRLVRRLDIAGLRLARTVLDRWLAAGPIFADPGLYDAGIAAFSCAPPRPVAATGAPARTDAAPHPGRHPVR